MMTDFYYILGTDINCSPNEIREAYHKLSKKFHPDLNQNDRYFESRFKEIREAFETLDDPARRREYDAAFLNLKILLPGSPAKKQRAYKKTTGFDVAFTLALLLITAIFGTYVYRAIYGAKAVRVNIAPVVAPASTHTSVRHKRKHKLKPVTGMPSVEIAKINSTLEKPPVDTVKPASAPRVPLTINAVKKPDNLAQQSNSLPPDNKPRMDNTTRQNTPAISNNSDQKADLYYAAYIKSNVTGVVNMHKFDYYNSDVIAAIPTNSKVLVLEKGKSFCKVFFNNNTGYVPNWTIQAK